MEGNMESTGTKKSTKTWFMVLGFVLAFLGFMSLGLSLIGVRISFLSWLYNLGSLAAFLIHIGMIMLGLILIFMASDNHQALLED